MGETLFTIGYEKRSISEFVGMLTREHIDAVVDVRDVAWSHKPGFAKSALRDHLEAAGIEYVHAQFVGNPKRLRAKGGTTKQLIARYARHLDAHETLIEQFDDLIKDLRSRARRIALMCFERDPETCHRSVVVDRWQQRGRRAVQHLGTDAPNPIEEPSTGTPARRQ
jgi:uncharacterized protein (DUF488 family)